MPTPAASIKNARLAHAYTQRDLAALCSVTQTAITLWEQGKRSPRPRYAARLEQALGLPSGSLTDKSPQRRNVEGSTTNHPEDRKNQGKDSSESYQ